MILLVDDFDKLCPSPCEALLSGLELIQPAHSLSIPSTPTPTDRGTWESLFPAFSNCNYQISAKGIRYNLAISAQLSPSLFYQTMIVCVFTGACFIFVWEGRTSSRHFDNLSQTIPCLPWVPIFSPCQMQVFSVVLYLQDWLKFLDSSSFFFMIDSWLV